MMNSPPNPEVDFFAVPNAVAVNVEDGNGDSNGDGDENGNNGIVVASEKMAEGLTQQHKFRLLVGGMLILGLIVVAVAVPTTLYVANGSNEVTTPPPPPRTSLNSSSDFCCRNTSTYCPKPSTSRERGRTNRDCLSVPLVVVVDDTKYRPNDLHPQGRTGSAHAVASSVLIV